MVNLDYLIAQLEIVQVMEFWIITILWAIIKLYICLQKKLKVKWKQFYLMIFWMMAY